MCRLYLVYMSQACAFACGCLSGFCCEPGALVVAGLSWHWAVLLFVCGYFLLLALLGVPLARRRGKRALLLIQVLKLVLACLSQAPGTEENRSPAPAGNYAEPCQTRAVPTSRRVAMPCVDASSARAVEDQDLRVWVDARWSDALLPFQAAAPSLTVNLVPSQKLCF